MTCLVIGLKVMTRRHQGASNPNAGTWQVYGLTQ